MACLDLLYIFGLLVKTAYDPHYISYGSFYYCTTIIMILEKNYETEKKKKMREKKYHLLDNRTSYEIKKQKKKNYIRA